MVLGWEEARQAAYDAAVPLATVVLLVGDALGLHLAAPLISADDLPRFDNAAMDGYAVAGPDPWRVDSMATARLRWVRASAVSTCVCVATVRVRLISCCPQASW